MAKPLDVKQLRDPGGTTGFVLKVQADDSIASEAATGGAGPDDENSVIAHRVFN